MTAYATERDLYTYGLRRGVLANPGRLVESSLESTDVLTLDGHLFETDDPVTLRAVEGGTLSAPLVADTVYYVIRLTDATFKLAASAGGAAINLTSNGETMVVRSAPPVAEYLELFSRWVDQFIPAHLVPLEPVAGAYPAPIVKVVCELAAAKLLSWAGQSSVSMTEAEVAAKAQLERWAAGIPVREVAATQASNKAVTSTVATAGDPRGWGSGALP